MKQRNALVVKNAIFNETQFQIFTFFLVVLFPALLPRNLFSFVSHLVLKMNRTDRQASPERMYPREAACKAAKQQGSQPERRLGFSGVVHESCQLEGSMCSWYQLLTGRKTSWQASYRWSKAEPWAIPQIVTHFCTL